MKRQIRVGVFETNSSSTHSLTLCSEEEYKRWANGEVLFYKWGSDDNKFFTNEEAKRELLKYYSSHEIEDIDLKDEGYCTIDEYFGDYELESFDEEYITPNGEKVIAFGKFGYNG